MRVQGAQKSCVQLMSLIVPIDKISLLKALLAHLRSASRLSFRWDRVSVAFPMEVKMPDLAIRAGLVNI